MNEEEIHEALKIIKEPITVNSIEYKYFDQENYEKLLRVYENCRWFISNAEQYLDNLQKENQSLKKQLDFIDEQNKHIDKLEKMIKDYKSRNEKAIKYIKENGCYDEKYFCDDLNLHELKELLNILEGGDE